MHPTYQKFIAFLAGQLPEILGLDPEEELEPGTSLRDCRDLCEAAHHLLHPTISLQCEELVPVLVELHRIAPEQGWREEWDGSRHLLQSANETTEVYVKTVEGLGRRSRFQWTVVTIGPFDTGPEDPAPSIDEVFTSSHAIDVARRAAIEDYTAITHYA